MLMKKADQQTNIVLTVHAHHTTSEEWIEGFYSEVEYITNLKGDRGDGLLVVGKGEDGGGLLQIFYKNDFSCIEFNGDIQLIKDMYDKVAS